MPKISYVHGYSEKQLTRLYDQARTLAALLHHDTRYPAGSKVLEGGCGVGAQTAILAKKSPRAHFTSVDISEKCLHMAESLSRKSGLSNVAFRQADLLALPFDNASFDHVFVCFVLEHLERPLEALKELRRVLKPGGTITVIEGDHGSCYFHPETKEARRAWQCLVKVQAFLKANSLIGRELYPVLRKAGFKNILVSPRFVYADETKPEMVKGFIRQTIIPMVEGVKEKSLSLKLIDRRTWRKGIADFYKTALPGGTFCYCFFKAVAKK